MKNRSMYGYAALFILSGTCGISAFAQKSPDAIDAHLIAARTAAGFDFTGTLARLCVAPTPVPSTLRDVAPGPAPARETWFAEPAKVFDNLYFVGSKIHSSWALTTSQGIILIDTLYTYNSEEEIVGGLKKLGLDPATVKYVIISHAHADHVGGAKLMQDRYGSHIVMGGPDWDSIDKSVNGYPQGKPKRDIVADDGQKITLGDTSVTIVTTPGHTPGTLSMLFTVRDGGKPIDVAYSGGTAFNFPFTVSNFDTYIKSQDKMAAAASAVNATILMSNHSEFDSAVSKIRMLGSRKPGEPHPFDLGREAVQRYFTVTKECAVAARLKLVQETKQQQGNQDGGPLPGVAENPPSAGPTPRLPEDLLLGVNSGKPDFGGKGIWQVPYIINMQKQGKTPQGGAVEVPFNTEGRKMFDYRTRTNSKDDPEGFCLPPGIPRMMYTPYPIQIYQMADRILFIYEGGAHVWRIIWMDGRQHPKDPNPTYLGDAIGHWEGDTLVVDTSGFNDRTWLDAAGHPHGEKLHVIERYTRSDLKTLRLEATIEDSDFYTKPWTVVTSAAWAPAQELLEYICQENNRDIPHLVGN